ncbi:hypothetical protein HQ584_11750 [Patescibacteria group bacterium]|nr:hypothetical protein [Patescibacteria group bacterium]
MKAHKTFVLWSTANLWGWRDYYDPVGRLATLHKADYVGVMEEDLINAKALWDVPLNRG